MVVKNLIFMLMFTFLISPKVWGNVNEFTVESENIFEFYGKNDVFLGLNITTIETRWYTCDTNLVKYNRMDAMAQNFSNNWCDTLLFEEEKDLFVGLEISKKDSKNRFSVSLQGGFNFGIRNEKREDGTQKIRVHANVKGLYDWGFMKGQYKGVFRFVSPGSTPYSSKNNDMFSNNYRIIFTGDHKREGLIFNKDIYIGIELTF
jgi:hypothetical protein